MSHKAFRRRASTPLHKSRHPLAAVALAAVLLSSAGCAAIDDEARYMDDTSGWNGTTNRSSQIAEGIASGIVAGVLLGLFFWGAWAGSSCGCHH